MVKSNEIYFKDHYYIILIYIKQNFIYYINKNIINIK